MSVMEGSFSALKVTPVYKPKCPEMYNLLFLVYGGLMTATPDELPVWIERFSYLFESWKAVKEVGAFPEFFMEHFLEDIQNVARRIDVSTDKQNITEPQRTFGYGIMGDLEELFMTRP